jgi:hypothetical protein
MEIADEIEILKERMAALQSEANSKQESNSKIAELHESLAVLESKLTFDDRLKQIEQELITWKAIAKVASIAASIIVTIFGIVLAVVGVHSVDSFVQQQSKYLKERTDKQIAIANAKLDYSSDLSYGLSLADKHPIFALPFLYQSFVNHPVNEPIEPIVITILNAADSADDLETARLVMEELRKHPDKVSQFTNAMTFNNIGLAELNLAQQNPAHTNLAKNSFEMGLRKAATDNDVNWDLHFNLWRYYLMVDDLRSAQQQVTELKRLYLPPGTENWERASNWRWFTTLFETEHTIKRQAIAAMYNEIVSKARKSQ